MKGRKYIIDTTLRDGEQSPGIHLNRTQKVMIAQLLEEAGVYQIEAGIPAVGKYERDTIREIIRNRKNTRIAVWSRLLEKDIAQCTECAPDVIHVSIPVSYVHIYTKLGKNKAWVLKQLYACMRLLERAGCEITFGFEDASRADMSFMITLARRLSELGIRQIRVADTVGVMTPSSCHEMIQTLINYTHVEVEYHAHNDTGMAVANTIEAMKAGAKYADTTLLGVGERAGNCDFVKLIYASNRIFDWNVSTFSAETASEGFRSIISATEI